MRVLMLGRLPSVEVGGLPLYTANLTEALADRGVEPLVLHPGPEPPAGTHPFATRAPAPRPLPADAASPHLRRLRSFRQAFAVAREARRALAESAPDLVHLQYGGAMDLALLHGVAGRGVPVVVTAHCGRAWAHLGRFPRPAMRVLGQADRVLVISADQRELFLGAGLDPARVHQVGSLVEEAFFAPVEPALAERALRREHGARPRAAYLGRIAPEKGLALAIDALALLAPDRRPVLTATGPVSDEHAAELRARAAERGVADAFELAPPVATVAERRAALDRADLLVHPTLSDVKPLVVIEAMARALPVVASDLPGTRELRAGTGRGVPVGEAPALAAAIAATVDELPGLGAGLAAREVAEAYRPSAAAVETLTHYRDLVARAGVRS